MNNITYSCHIVLLVRLTIPLSLTIFSLMHNLPLSFHSSLSKLWSPSKVRIELLPWSPLSFLFMFDFIWSSNVTSLTRVFVFVFKFVTLKLTYPISLKLTLCPLSPKALRSYADLVHLSKFFVKVFVEVRTPIRVLFPCGYCGWIHGLFDFIVCG